MSIDIKKNTQDPINKLKRLIVVTGHYGCGKTNFSLNLAVDFNTNGEQVKLIDLDIVNPYFIASDFKEMLSFSGISLIASKFAGSLSDTPSVPREITAAIRGNARVIIDVGGDDVGARALGRFHNDFEESSGVDLIYLFSIFRPQTGSIKDVKRHIEDIEKASRQKVSYLVNSSNLGKETTKEDIEGSKEFAKRLAEYSDIPLLMTLSIHKEANIKESTDYSIKRYVKLPWEE